MDEYVGRLRDLQPSDEGVNEMYRWFWSRQIEIGETAKEINRKLKLENDYALKADLPCLTTGSRKRLLVVALNPAWHEKDNQKENDICLRSEHDYINLMLNYFEEYPKRIRRIRWWGQAMAFIRLLPSPHGFDPSMPANIKWQSVHNEKLIGGWEIFPFHSPKDGISRKVNEHPSLKNLATESLKAAARMRPEVLLIASRVGRELALKTWPNLLWQHVALGANQLSHCKASLEFPEIIAISCQISARRFSNDSLDVVVAQLRQQK